MIAENKTEFFEELERELQRLGIDDTSELFADLEEHFAEGERRGISESEVCRELGSIREIARSCLDLKSSAINSMVAHEATRKKAVSLTKPGRDIPADPSLAKPKESQNETQEEVLREVTPEHIAEEVVPSVTNSVTPEAASQEASSENDSQNPQKAGMFEKIGKNVDAACDKAGQALNGAIDKAGDALGKAGNKVGDALKNTPFRPSDSYRSNINNENRKSEIPNQSGQMRKIMTKNGTQYVDVSQLKKRDSFGRVLFELILDFLLWIWLVPMLMIFNLALFVGSVAIAIAGIVALLGFWNEFAGYYLPTRILFALGFFAVSTAVFCLACLLARPILIGLPRYVGQRHFKARYYV